MTTTYDHSLAAANADLYRARPITTAYRLDELDDVLEAFAYHGLVVPPDAVARQKRAEAIAAGIITPAGAEAEQRALVGRLVAGTIGPDEAAERASSIERRSARDSAAGSLLRTAYSETRTSIMHAIIDSGDNIIEQMRPKIAELVDEATDLAAVLGDDVRDDTAAVHGTPEQLLAWVRLRDLARRWTALHDFADTLRGMAFLPSEDTSFFFPVTYRYRNPSALPKQFQATEYWPLILVDPITAGALPTILTDAEVQASRTAVTPTPDSDPFEDAHGGARDDQMAHGDGVPASNPEAYSRTAVAAAIG